LTITDVSIADIRFITNTVDIMHQCTQWNEWKVQANTPFNPRIAVIAERNHPIYLFSLLNP